MNCRVSGRFEIRDGKGKPVKSGGFGLVYNGLMDEPTLTTNAFRFASRRGKEELLPYGALPSWG